MNQSRKRYGFLLVMVLVLIATASTMLATMASRSLRMISVADAAENAMQTRWARHSLASLGLSGESVAAKPQNVRLCGNRWRILAADESAKVSLVHLAERYTEPIYQKVAGDLITTGDISASMRLVPPNNTNSRRWQDWLPEPVDADGETRSLDGSGIQTLIRRTSAITLWGDGKINIYTAQPQTLEILWQQIFGQRVPKELEVIRSLPGTATISAISGQLELSDGQFGLLTQWFTTETTCRSVWIWQPGSTLVRPIAYVQWDSGISLVTRGYEY